MSENDNIFHVSQILLDLSADNQNEVFEKIAQKAVELKIINQKDIKKLIVGFQKRELAGSTGFEDGFAIPHVLINEIKRPAVFFIRLKKAIDWKSFDKKLTNIIIAICVPAQASEQHLEILAQIARSLTNEETRKLLKTTKDKQKILKSLLVMSKASSEVKEEIVTSNSSKTKGLILGVSSCTTGVVHTYMAKELLEKVGQEMGYDVHIECQGQKGQEFPLTAEEINRADVIIMANDVGVDMERFVGKNVFQSSAITATDKPREVIEQALKYKKIYGKKQDDADFIQAAGKGKAPILRHLLSGVSYLIPFVVFAGLTFAIIGGIAHGIWGSSFAFQGDWKAQMDWNVANNIVTTDSMHALFIINSIANIGFSLMIPIMGAFIAFSIAGRPAIAPAMIVTWLLVNPSVNLWWNFDGALNMDPPKAGIFTGSSANSWTLFGALYAGLIEGYFVKWVNSWKTPKWLSPIMPIIVIPFFCTLIVVIPTAFLIAAPFGYVMGALYFGLSWMGNHPNIGFVVGLILGAMVGFDLGGPINKTAVLVATSLMVTDQGRLMGPVAAAIPVAPWGAALTSTVFARKYFTKQERALGINAWILGFMGISESAIPFVVRDTWRAIIPNVIASAVAGALAFLFNVQGHVGAWGGYIIALFGGVTDTSGNYIGILWYIIAIAIAAVVHSLIYTSLLLNKERFFQNLVSKMIKPFKKNNKNSAKIN